MAQGSLYPLPPQIEEVYLDIETLRLSHEVEGGWGNIQGFGLAVAVTWDAGNAFRAWFEADAARLVAELDDCKSIVTFNGNRFDLEVLRHYVPGHKLLARSFDVHEDLYRRLGHRVKLDQLARDTLGTAKSGDGTQAVSWWRAGEKKKVVEYCEKDVAILRDLVTYGRDKGHVVLSSRQISVDWAKLR
jgi:DEAD/DEAH box helicase domain-containing protein